MKYLIIILFGTVWSVSSIASESKKADLTSNPLLLAMIPVKLNSLMGDISHDCWINNPISKIKKPELSPEYSKLQNQYEKCKIERYNKIQYKFPLYDQPNPNSTSVGELIISTPDGGILFLFKSQSEAEKRLQLDSVQSDRAYRGNYHTVLRKEGNWVQLPKNPFKAPVWLQLTNDLNRVIPLKDLRIISVETSTVTGDIVIDEEHNGYLIVHMESEHDMDCGEGLVGEERELAMKKLKRIKLPIKELLDKDQHLKFKLKYARGC